MCSVRFSLVFEFLFRWGILLSRVSFLFAGTKPNKPTHNNTESGGQRGWDWGFPALHPHHSGTIRKHTQNGKRCGNNSTIHRFLAISPGSFLGCLCTKYLVPGARVAKLKTNQSIMLKLIGIANIKLTILIVLGLVMG